MLRRCLHRRSREDRGVKTFVGVPDARLNVAEYSEQV